MLKRSVASLERRSDIARAPAPLPARPDRSRRAPALRCRSRGSRRAGPGRSARPRSAAAAAPARPPRLAARLAQRRGCPGPVRRSAPSAAGRPTWRPELAGRVCASTGPTGSDRAAVTSISDFKRAFIGLKPFILNETPMFLIHTRDPIGSPVTRRPQSRTNINVKCCKPILKGGWLRIEGQVGRRFECRPASPSTEG